MLKSKSCGINDKNLSQARSTMAPSAGIPEMAGQREDQRRQRQHRASGNIQLDDRAEPRHVAKQEYRARHCVRQFDQRDGRQRKAQSGPARDGGGGLCQGLARSGRHARLSRRLMRIASIGRN